MFNQFYKDYKDIRTVLTENQTGLTRIAGELVSLPATVVKEFLIDPFLKLDDITHFGEYLPGMGPSPSLAQQESWRTEGNWTSEDPQRVKNISENLSNMPKKMEKKRKGTRRPKPRRKGFARGVQIAVPARNRGRLARNRGRGRTIRGRGGRFAHVKSANAAKSEAYLRNIVPLSYATNGRSGLRIETPRALRAGCQRMRFHFKVCQIGTQAPNSIVQPTFTSLGLVSANTDMIIPIIPTNSFYFPTFITNFAQCFNFYYMNFVSILISPRVPTTNTASCTLGSTNEPMWLENRGLFLSSGGYSYPNEVAISCLNNACTDVLYRPCVVIADNVSTRRKFRILRSNLTGQLVWTGSNQDANFTQSIPAIFMIAGVKNGSDSTGVIYADVYMTLDIEFCEFTSAPTQTSSLQEDTKIGVLPGCSKPGETKFSSEQTLPDFDDTEVINTTNIMNELGLSDSKSSLKSSYSNLLPSFGRPKSTSSKTS